MNESRMLAKKVLEGFLLPADIIPALEEKIAVALEDSWNQGFEDCLMDKRLRKAGVPQTVITDSTNGGNR